MSDRNPKIDPQPGDVVLGKNGSINMSRTVMYRNGSNVIYTRGLNKKEHLCWITTWHKWASKGTVKVQHTQI